MTLPPAPPLPPSPPAPPRLDNLFGLSSILTDRNLIDAAYLSLVCFLLLSLFYLFLQSRGSLLFRFRLVRGIAGHHRVASYWCLTRQSCAGAEVFLQR